jgi:pimeloyl-ACP methyl ester carboxylesterase
MGEYIDIGGHPTWVDQRGSGPATILVLHGGLSNSDLLLETIGPPLAERYRLVAFDRRGHGYTADTAAPFHYEDMAAETIGVLEAVVGGPAHLVGWSDGGIVGLLVALHRPELIDRMVLIGANFHHNGFGSLDLPEESPFVRAIVEAYAERSPDGGEHFGEVFEKFTAMVTTEPTLTTDDLGRITAPTLVMAGDDDAVLLSHTCEMYEALPDGQLSIVPGTSHMLPIERPDVTARTVLDFLGADVPPTTLMPVRRAQAIA